MISAFLLWLAYALAGCAVMPFVALAGTLPGTDWAPAWVSPFVFVVTVILFFLIGNVLRKEFKKIVPALEAHTDDYVSFLDNLPAKKILPAVFLSACGSLFLEMIFIRWQSSCFEFFAFYKNFSLLACFAGLGIGYAISDKRPFPISISFSLTAALVAFFSFIRYGIPYVWSLSLRYIPVREQTTMGALFSSTAGHYIAVYFFLALTFVLTALAFVSVGQLCGRLMQRTDPLKAYSANLAGSLVGILILLLVSFLWTPPVTWFILAFAMLIPFATFTRGALITASVSILVATLMLSWPTQFPAERIYSPYQLIERVPTKTGLSELIASGHYYQRILDLSLPNQEAKPELKKSANYYGLPYQFHPNPERVLIVGAGTGNDVAAALRAGAKHVDAVEIDPAIQAFGKHYHPEHPYDDPRVRVVVNDARAFFNSTKDKYDAVVFALLDSHTLTSQASNLRLDSYVYTRESISKARSLLNENGTLSLSFTFCGPELTKKIEMMMSEAFGGHKPVCLYTKYDNALFFAQSRNSDLTIPAGLLEKTGFEDGANFLDTLEVATPDISTDDWPFFYLPRKVFPFSYLPMILLTVILSGLLLQHLNPQTPKKTDLAFFFLGAGFMLIETKAITELGLYFGNTWLVTGIVVSAVLIMAFLANTFVSFARPRMVVIPYLLLFASIVGGGIIAKSGPGDVEQLIFPVILLTCPLFFSGIVFSTALRNSNRIGSAMSLNLFGAMLGGVLEYNAMWLGYGNLYVIALVLYACALFCSLQKNTQTEVGAVPVVPGET